MTREIIEDFRSIVIPYMVNRLKEINYEGQGISDANEFMSTFNELCDLAIKALEQEPTIDYRRAFKIACELLSGSVLYGIDSDKIFETAMQKDGLVSNESYERYILNHLQELDHGQYAEVEE